MLTLKIFQRKIERSADASEAYHGLLSPFQKKWVPEKLLATIVTTDHSEFPVAIKLIGRIIGRVWLVNVLTDIPCMSVFLLI